LLERNGIYRNIICLKEISVMETSQAEYLPPYEKRENTPYLVDGETIDHEIGSLAGVRSKDDRSRGMRIKCLTKRSVVEPETT